MSFKNILLLTAITGALGSTSALAGPSAKFAATWDTDSPKYVSVAVIENATEDTPVILDRNKGFLLTTMKVPQDKELLVGVSAEIGIVTDTSIKGKDGGAARAIAGGVAKVLVTATPVDGGESVIAAPGTITLSKRIQELSATLGGDDVCIDTTGGTDSNGLNPGDEGYTDTPDGTIDVLLECTVTDEEIGLMQKTLASQHFNFVLPNMDAGEYEIKAFFITKATAEVDIDEISVEDGGTVSGSAFAKAFVGKNMITVQQVRATQSLSDFDIVE
ncbi:hypothetical protein [Vibrio natriegens]|uniref:hypothetical protein n=1 Tax=Vibrio natriegens TaxID=691 RepID=UPI000803ECC3|nr:hypothetical protein [Vibrio natriegens]ANQ19152.1 hypothetical protein BA891_18385 [Vibrio natriegens]